MLECDGRLTPSLAAWPGHFAGRQPATRAWSTAQHPATNHATVHLYRKRTRMHLRNADRRESVSAGGKSLWQTFYRRKRTGRSLHSRPSLWISYSKIAAAGLS